MAYRQIHTQIWKDSWFLDLEPQEKLLFIYLFSNDNTNLIGLYEISLKIIAFETGLELSFIHAALAKFQQAGKVVYEDGYLWVVNLRKYNENRSPHVQKRIDFEISQIPAIVMLKTGYLKQNDDTQYGIDTISPPYTEKMPLTESLTESLTEAVQDNKPPATSFSAPTFLAVTNFHDNDAREAEQLYQKITGQVTIPSDQRERAMGDLSAIVPYYRGRNGDAVTEGQQIFNRWCNTRGKSGRNYSRTNPGWLAWWLEALAPIPLAPPVPEYDPGITREEAAAIAERQRAQLAQEKLAKLAEQKRI